MTAIVHTAELFAKAQERAEQRFVMLRADKFNTRLVMRYVRSLRACHRLQKQLLRESKTTTETTQTQPVENETDD